MMKGSFPYDGTPPPCKDAVYSNETAAKPYGDPQNDTIRVPQKPVLLCLKTGNQCGTDTWPIGGGCQCRNCLTHSPMETRWKDHGDWNVQHIPPEKRSDQPWASDKPTGMRSGYVGPCGPVGSGVPNQYPLAINTPLDRAYLRPLQQPLVDSEWYVPTKGIKELVFFCNPINDKFHHLDEQKTKHDTNLISKHMLSYPLEHSILGFRASLDPKTSQADRDALLSHGALVEFRFSGNRNYLQVPFSDICAARKDAQSSGQILSNHELVETTRHLDHTDPALQPSEQERRARELRFGPVKAQMSGHAMDGVEHTNQKLVEMAIQLLDKTCGKNYYPFNLGRSALKIKPDEAFSMTLSWKKTPLVSRPVRITMEIVGLLWQPL
jgi:hypothetical protein